MTREKHITKCATILLAALAIATCHTVHAEHENYLGIARDPQLTVASHSPLAVDRDFIYAVAEDHTHLLKRLISSGPWQQYNTDIQFTWIMSLAASATVPETPIGTPPIPGSLYVADRGSGSIYRVRIDTGAAELLYKGAPVSGDCELALSHDNLFMACAPNSIHVLDLNQKTFNQINFGVVLPSYGRLYLATSGNQVFISNPQAGILTSLTNPLWPQAAVRSDYLCPSNSSVCASATPNKSPATFLQAVLPPSDKLAALQHPGPIAVEQGVIYVVDLLNRQVFASSQHMLRPVRLYSWDHKVMSPSSIVLSGPNIILFDDATRDVAIWPLLTPTELVVDVKTSESLSAIYNYLYDQGLLPTKVAPLEHSVEKTLRNQGALLSPYVASLNPVMCGLNPSICKQGNIKEHLAAGIDLVVPDLYSEDFIDVRQLKLDGSHTLDYEIDHRIRSDTFKAWKTEEKLEQLNPQYRPSVIHRLMSQTNGTFTVPVELVRYLVALPLKDLTSADSKLVQIQARYSADLTLYPLQEVKTTVQQDPSIQQFLVGLDKASFQVAYTKLLSTIHYRHPAPLPFHPISYIGVAEDIIDCTNPDITDVCSMPVSEITTTPQSIVHKESAATATFRDFQKTDHGTAIAGLLAARQTQYTATGLVAPEGYVVPLISREPPLADEIKSAVLQTGAQVFNLSFAFDDGAPPQKIADEIALGTSETLVNAIFIVAAPDDGKPVCTGILSYPICWANQPNVIGVAATILDGSELIPNDQGPAWGKQYVQIAAPGIGFGAPALNGNYVPVAGTSFAAPLVSAAAALLIEQGVTDPRLIKQRIIATSTVVGAYKDKVLGGLLNVDRAISHVAEGVLIDGSGNEKIVQLVKGGKLFITSGKGNFTIDLKNVLRLTLQQNGKYRIIFQNEEDNTKLEIWDDVSYASGAGWKIKYRLSSAPGAALGLPVSDDLTNYGDYFGPILN
ncbi:MAG: S8/S53 family peptidase [Silvibacterium sp.]